jgi:hypothetical protein
MKKVLEGRKPSEKSLEILKFGRELYNETPESLVDAAKTFVTLEASLLTAYIGIFTFLKINEKLNNRFNNSYIAIIIILWLLSIVLTSLAIFPFRYDTNLISPDSITESVKELISWKQRVLILGLIFLILALLASIFFIWHEFP